MKRPLLVLFCLSVGLASVTPASAQTASAGATASAPLAESLKGEARAAYDAGKLLFEDGDATGALAKFQRAHELSGDPRLLWNMAVCEKELRHYARAARYVASYLEAGQGKISAESRQSAEATRDALRAFYSELSLVGVPPGSRVSVDGSSVGTAPLTGPIPVDLGRRRIRVEAPGFEVFEQQLDVPGATPMSMKVALTPAKTSGMLRVSSSDAQDVIAIDGKVVGSRQWQGALPAGEHVVRVTARGKKPYETRVQLSIGADRSLQVTLQDESKPVIWPWIAGGAAVLVGAGIGGYFLLKPDDAPGEAPHGKLGTIYLPAGW